MKKESKRLSVCGFAAVLCACSAGDYDAGQDPEASKLGTIQDEIVSGFTVTQNTLGTVAVYHGSFSRPCSGTHLGDRWVITARHCVQVDPFNDASALLAPSQVFVTGALSPGAPRPNPASLPAGTFSDVAQVQDFSTGVDLAMVRLTTQLTAVPAVSGRVQGTNAQVGLNLECRGYGRSQNLLNPDTPQGDATTGAGTLRRATLNVMGRFSGDPPGREDGPFQLAFQRNDQGQIMYHGDSGGPCYNGNQLVTVNRSIDSNTDPMTGFSVSVAKDTPWSRFIDWWKLSDVGIATAQPGFVNVVKHAIPRSNLLTVFNSVVSSGFMPVWIDGYEVGGQTFFNQVFAPSDGFTVTELRDMTVSGFQTEFNNKLAQGMILSQIDSYLVSGEIRFAAIWDNRPHPAMSAYHNVTEQQHIANFNSLISQGFRPVNVSTVVVGGQRRFTALWDKASVGAIATFSFMTEAEYQTQFTQQLNNGLRLAYINGCMEGGVRKITAIWNQANFNSMVARHAMSDADYLAAQNSANGSNLTTRALAGFQNGSAHSFAALWN